MAWSSRRTWPGRRRCAAGYLECVRACGVELVVVVAGDDVRPAAPRPALAAILERGSLERCVQIRVAPCCEECRARRCGAQLRWRSDRGGLRGRLGEGARHTDDQNGGERCRSEEHGARQSQEASLLEGRGARKTSACPAWRKDPRAISPGRVVQRVSAVTRVSARISSMNASVAGASPPWASKLWLISSA
jgi:hypothetical protein